MELVFTNTPPSSESDSSYSSSTVFSGTSTPEEEPEPEIDPFENRYYAKAGGLMKVQFDVKPDNVVDLSIPGVGASVTGTYERTNSEVTMTFGDTTYTAAISSDYTKLTYSSVTGTDAYATALTDLSFVKADIADNAEQYEEAGQMYYQGNTDEGMRSGARGAYFCDYYGGSGTDPVGGPGWTLMGGNGDQLDLDKTTGADGNQSLMLKFSTAGAMRYLEWGLFKGTGQARTGYNKFVIHLKNTNSYDVPNIKIMVYSAMLVTPSNHTTAKAEKIVTVPANSDWTPYEVELDPTHIYYGFGILSDYKGNKGFIHADLAYYTKGAVVDVDTSLSYFTKKDLELTGNISVGESSIKFDEGGKFSFTCENAGISAQQGTYTMVMRNGQQEITMTLGETTIRGNYSVNMAGEVSIVVLEATGPMASYIPANTTFTN